VINVGAFSCQAIKLGTLLSELPLRANSHFGKISQVVTDFYEDRILMNLSREFLLGKKFSLDRFFTFSCASFPLLHLNLTNEDVSKQINVILAFVIQLFCRITSLLPLYQQTVAQSCSNKNHFRELKFVSGNDVRPCLLFVCDA
jgi:hypothetical protein